MVWTTPRTWVAGETVTAAIMNTHVRDNLAFLGAVVPDAGDIYGDQTTSGSSSGLGGSGANARRSAAITFTLATTRRVRIAGAQQFLNGGASDLIVNCQAGYTAGATAFPNTTGGTTTVPATTLIGVPVRRAVTALGATVTGTATGVEASVLLAAGTWTAYIHCYRVTGGAGDNSDLILDGYCAVYDAGPN